MSGRRSLAAGACLLATGLFAACLDNPYGRPATIVDGAGFPPEVRGVLLPRRGYSGGASVDIYLFGDVAPQLSASAAIAFTDEQGQPLPACRTGERDGDGQVIDVDLDACQGPLLPDLPGTPGYAPFTRLATIAVPDDYRPNQVRSIAELADLGLAPTVIDQVATLALIDPNATLIDPAAAIPRDVGWFQTLKAVYLDLGALTVPVGEDMPAMELFTPVGLPPGAAGTIAAARVGEPGYSTLCRVIYYQTPPDYQPGDYQDVADVPAPDRISPDPDEYMLCAVP